MMDSYMNTPSDELILAAREHNDGAFSELVARYTPMINKVISGFSDPRFRYDEAFSEACVSLHRAVMSYDVSKSSDITFGLYARICVYRRLCDLFRKVSRDALIVDVDIESIGTNVNIEQRIVGRERISEYIEKAHGILSEYEYQVFLLYIDGYSTAEISAKLCKDTKSVENAKLRMFKRLREVSNIFSDI